MSAAVSTPVTSWPGLEKFNVVQDFLEKNKYSEFQNHNGVNQRDVAESAANAESAVQALNHRDQHQSRDPDAGRLSPKRSPDQRAQ